MCFSSAFRKSLRGILIPKTIYVKFEEKQQILYDQMMASIRRELLRKSDRYEIKNNSIMIQGLLYLQEICCHPDLIKKELNPGGCKESAKLDLLIQLLLDLNENKRKVVVFSRFTKMLKLIEKQVIANHMNCYYLGGETKNRMDIVDEFEQSISGVFLISLKAGGTGINLTSADTAIIYDPWGNPASERQAEDRIYRIGQKNNVMIYRLIVQNSVEEKIQNLQEKKLKLCAEILDGHEVPQNMTIELMEQIILGDCD